MAEDEQRARRRDTSLPASAFSRGAKLAALPVGFAGRTAIGVGRRIGGAPADAVLTEVQRRTAEQIFSVLGQLKGGAMKFGQAMSIFEAALPDEIAGPYRETLTRLQDAAPPMPPDVVHRALATQLGEQWRELLVEIDDEPAAAASIGQVHRGRWHDGREVAIKVQYPGAAKALRSDLRQLARLSRLFGVLAPGLDVKPLIAELQDRVAEELDYELEADSQRAFHDAYADDPEVSVPAVVHSSPQVLITEWMDSDGSLAGIIKDGAQADRDHYGALYARFLLEGPGRVGLLHADPHPGNFRVLADGRMGVVDFGAVARLPDGLPPAIGPLLRTAIEGDAEAVSQGLRDEGFLREGTSIEPEVLSAYLGPFFEPAVVEEFGFNREWLRSQMQRLSSPGVEGMATSLRINLPPEYLLIHRVWLGGVGVLSQLEATAPFRSILQDTVPGFAGD
ncbi:ABC1 kinase family protein [Aeromicrobium sp. CTD01-1L150]|uniref:ABC1 kinase family protein n=1 Tax=Aeromicrobium sp. CTD01-1L150 TaxID=3341830 RepID=UPI0035BEEE91